MFAILQQLFDSTYMSHGHCYLWQPGLVWLHAGADTLIALSYFAIPFALWWFVQKRKDLAFRWMFGMFAAFILLCGTTHLLGIWTIWNGTYWLTGSVKLVTGVVSFATAALLFPMVPRALDLPSPEQMRTANEALRAEVERRKAVEEELRAHQEELERLVAERTKDLEETNAHLNQEVQRRQAAQEELEMQAEDLREAKQAAEQATRAKSNFLATMSHEIRTPLNGVIGYADLLRSTGLNERQDGYVSVILNSGDRLLQLINDILDLSKIEAGHLELQPHPFEIRPALQDLLLLFKPQADSKGLDLGLTVSDRVPTTLVADEPRLIQVLTNLLSNALKFTDDGEVQLRVDAEVVSGDEVRLILDVKDTGIGIDTDGQKLLFQPFQQVDHGRRRRYGGTGLGLVISARIIEAMDGTLTVQSELGSGSVFTATPVVHAPDALYGHPVEPSQASPTDLPQPSSLRILIAEDDGVNARVLQEMLHPLEATVHVVGNGYEVLDALEAHSFDLVLMDVRMPEMDGLTATREVRRRYPEGDLRIVAVTAEAMVSDRELCLEAGCDAYLAKPLRRQDLLDIIHQVTRET